MAIQHFRKLTKIFYKDNTKKPIAILLSIHMISTITRLSIRLKSQTSKQKRGQPARPNGANKHAKSS